jgi:WD40 repeat protein
LHSPATNELVFAAGSLVIAMPASHTPPQDAAAPAQQQQQQQRLFLGHSAWVSCLALGGQGSLLATGQEGKQAVIRLWDFGSPPSEGGKCLAVLCGEHSSSAASAAR